MEDELLFDFQVGTEALRLLVVAVDKYLEQWPGGDPHEQMVYKDIQTDLRKAYLELKFLEGDE